ncbi:MAG: hypothetical protein GX874_12895 [Smithella sp.]|jgi:hypothetical protein|nr:hypothetical protein [Smithellaceae bacterium]NLA42269.1 hypothetical protein [Smithella sp.]
MKNKRHWLIVAILGMMLAYPVFGRPASAIPEDFLKTGSDNSGYNGESPGNVIIEFRPGQ